MFASGQVWFPENRWAAETVEEILAFPAGEHDDEVDAATLALIRARKGGMMRLTSDVDHLDPEPYFTRRKAMY
jgi:phage terminase large subunit-like protein